MLIIGGLIGIPFLGKWQGSAGTFVLYIIIGMFITAVLTAVLTMLAMLFPNRAVNAVASLVLILIFMMVGSIIYNGLSEPEMTREFLEMSMDGVTYGPEIPNPAYISGIQRKIYEFLLQLLPFGQGILMVNGEITQPVLNIIYSVVLTAGINIIGIFAFKKKDLK